MANRTQKTVRTAAVKRAGAIHLNGGRHDRNGRAYSHIEPGIEDELLEPAHGIYDTMPLDGIFRAMGHPSGHRRSGC